MFHIALYEPELPPNTGNIIRLCANTGFTLHLIKPLGFNLSDRQLKRAGLDYHDLSNVLVHESYQDFQDKVSKLRVYAFSTHGKIGYTEVKYRPDDVFLFGPETRGLPVDVRTQFEESKVLRLPMKPNSRSLNLSNTAAIVAYEAWRQVGFK